MSRKNSAMGLRLVKILGMVLLSAIVSVSAVVIFYVNRGPDIFGREIPLTPDYLKALKVAGYEYTPTRVYEIGYPPQFNSSATTLKACKFSPSESLGFLESIRRKFPSFEWDESPAGAHAAEDLIKKLPGDLQVDRFRILLVGFDRKKMGGLKFLLDGERGILYTYSW